MEKRYAIINWTMRKHNPRMYLTFGHKFFLQRPPFHPIFHNLLTRLIASSFSVSAIFRRIPDFGGVLVRFVVAFWRSANGPWWRLSLGNAVTLSAVRSRSGSACVVKVAASSQLDVSSSLNLMLFRKVLRVELVLVVLPERRKFPRIGLCRSLGDEETGEELVDFRCWGK